MTDVATDLINKLISLCELRDISKILYSCHLGWQTLNKRITDVSRTLRTSSIVGSCLLIALRSSIDNAESSRSRRACRIAGYPILKRDSIIAITQRINILSSPRRNAPTHIVCPRSLQEGRDVLLSCKIGHTGRRLRCSVNRKRNLEIIHLELRNQRRL